MAMTESKPRTWGSLAATVVTAVLLCVSLGLIFFVAPVEAQMGIVQKIFFFHVPSAYAMYIGFAVSALGSALYLRSSRERWDALGVAGAEVGFVFCAIVLVTGPLWARKAWGLWWTWDPRLTTTLLSGLIFLSYLSVRGFGRPGRLERRLSAGLAVLGVLNIPLIHYSVQRWRGQHPKVISSGGGGIHPDMMPALWSGFITFTALAALMIWVRYRVERNSQTLDEVALLSDDHLTSEKA